MMYSTDFDLKYSVAEKLGEGAFGCVMRCEHKETGKAYAAKIIKASCPNFTEIANLKEISILRKIPKHPNVLRLHEAFVNRRTRQVTLVFPLMHQNLEEYIRTADYIGETRAKTIFYQIISGLDHLHSYKVFHRDIKPENILTRGSLVIVGDMGSLKYIHQMGHHTEYIATRWYRSPECLLTVGHYSSEMDIWAAGCVFYETITRTPLFPGDSEVDQLDCIHKLLGTPKTELLQKFEKHKSSNFTYHFKRYAGAGLDALVPQIQDKGRKLLAEMLRYDPKRRPTAAKILNHAYFSDLTQLKHELQKKKMMDKIAQAKVSHPNHILAKPSRRPDIGKLIQSDVDTQKVKKARSDYLHVARSSKYRLDKSSSVLLRAKMPSVVKSKTERKLFVKEKMSDLDSRRRIEQDFQERKSKIKQKLNLLL